MHFTHIPWGVGVGGTTTVLWLLALKYILISFWNKWLWNMYTNMRKPLHELVLPNFVFDKYFDEWLLPFLFMKLFWWTSTIVSINFMLHTFYEHCTIHFRASTTRFRQSDISAGYIYTHTHIWQSAAEIDIQISWPVEGQHLYSALYYYSTPDIYSTPMLLLLSSIIIISHMDW